MNNRNSVALIEPVGGHAGMDYYDFGLCMGLVHAGVRTTLYTCDETADAHISRLSVHKTYRKIYGTAPLWNRGMRYLAGTIETFTQVLANRERICHFHFFHGAPRELMLALIAKALYRKVVITVHDVVSFAGSGTASLRAKRFVYKLADRLIVHNEFSRDELAKQSGVPCEKIVIIRHGVPTIPTEMLLSAESARKELGLPKQSKVVLFLGQIKEVKGLDILLGAISIVVRSVPEAVFLIAGRPWKIDFNDYQSMIDEADVRDHCILNIQYVPNEMLPTYYGAATVVALPYRKIYQSAVLLTAMSYGRPAVVSDVPGMLAIVKDGVNGYVFRDGSSAELATVLIRALQNDSERDAIARCAKKYLRENHDWNAIGKLMAEMYDSIR